MLLPAYLGFLGEGTVCRAAAEDGRWCGDSCAAASCFVHDVYEDHLTHDITSFMGLPCQRWTATKGS